MRQNETADAYRAALRAEEASIDQAECDHAAGRYDGYRAQRLQREACVRCGQPQGHAPRCLTSGR